LSSDNVTPLGFNVWPKYVIEEWPKYALVGFAIKLFNRTFVTLVLNAEVVFKCSTREQEVIDVKIEKMPVFFVTKYYVCHYLKMGRCGI